MYYLIDGYNLVFRLYSSLQSLQHSRQITIASLSEKMNALAIEAAIVFDAQYTLDESTRGHYAGLEIHFTAHQETADDKILQMISEDRNPSKITVVTSDKPLASKARLQGARAISVDTFISWLDRRCKNIPKKGLKPKKPVYSPKPAAQPPKKKPLPTQKTSIDECTDYYLSVFSQNMPVAEPLPEKLPRLKKKMHPEEIPEGKKIEENPLEYYQKIFEDFLK